jgi:NAD(P)-dependent dehydrogenase (short-subunit alcohol dehydrogenase family)
MGLAAATALAAEGARVAIAGRDAARAEAAAKQIGADSEVIALAGDVNADGGAEGLVAAAAERLGGLAGIAVTTGTGGAAQSDPERSTDAVWA